MSEVKQFRLPDVGEGLTEADIVTWHVKPGDSVTLNQVIVEIETAKAVVELPSPYEGVVTELLAEEGSSVDVGTPIIAVDVTGEAAATEAAGRSATTDVPAGSTPAGTSAASDRDSAPAAATAPPASASEPAGAAGPAGAVDDGASANEHVTHGLPLLVLQGRHLRTAPSGEVGVCRLAADVCRSRELGMPCACPRTRGHDGR